MNLNGHDIGICSWSLRTSNVDELIAHLDTLELDHLQIALNPLLALDEDACKAAIEKLDASEIALTAGMIGFAGESYSSIASIRKTGGLVPAELWEARRDLAVRAAALAQTMGLDQVSLHLGFLPPGHDVGYRPLIDRTREIAKEYEQRGLDILLETGQERASDLLTFLNDLNVRNVHVNFDPANMILYGSGDPIEAVMTLGRHIRHVHIKDAIASARPGVEWGTEVAFGTGDVDHTDFLRALSDVGYDGPLIIECEAGDNRLGWAKTAIDKLTELLA